MTKLEKIEKIRDIILDYGLFTLADVEAESSPFLNTKGKLSHLAEEFSSDSCVIRVYDPNSHTDNEIDSYNVGYDEFEEEQIDYILELAGNWGEINN